MKTSRQQLGAIGENLAADHYTGEGSQIRQRNVNYPCGEIDLIVEEPDGTTVFVEVKTRSSRRYGTAEAVHSRKLNRMRRAAATWLAGQPYREIRFDVVAVVVDPRTGSHTLERYEGVENGAR